jgi:hypothetical protein
MPLAHRAGFRSYERRGVAAQQLADDLDRSQKNGTP